MSPDGNILQTIIQYHKREIDFYTCPLSYSDLQNFTCHCVYQLNTILSCAGFCIYNHRQDTEQFHYHKDPLCCPFIIRLISHRPSPSNQPFATSRLFSIYIILSLQECYINGIIQHIQPLEIGCVSLSIIPTCMYQKFNFIAEQYSSV